jgi:hypothetical protein
MKKKGIKTKTKSSPRNRRRRKDNKVASHLLIICGTSKRFKGFAKRETC